MLMNDLHHSALQELDYNEFRLFVLAAIDMQVKLEAKERSKSPTRFDFVKNLRTAMEWLGVYFS